MVNCSFFSLALQRSSSAIAMIDPCWKCDQPAEQAVHGHSQQCRLPRRRAERRCARPLREKARHSIGARRLLIVSQMAMRAWHKVRGESEQPAKSNHVAMVARQVKSSQVAVCTSSAHGPSWA